ncbi:Indole-3-acetic acid-induced protein ARG7 [Acorus gramineus]|uniref:Indole-3-acetic acid-induced protein ARG7 n=1 Tax=Acorus gramineus TaxID=55184 RepID=A0AAV9AXC7_ACOGR|nr:Indole-3-acetic acid-induced protein ARG7 [Acorus gramineus]
MDAMERWKRQMRRWRDVSLRLLLLLRRRHHYRHFRHVPSGHLAVYVGHERRRFVIPTKYLSLPFFVSLLKKAEEEFGFGSPSGLVLPCDPDSFEAVLKALGRDERVFRGLPLDEAIQTATTVGGVCRELSPLLEKAN